MIVFIFSAAEHGGPGRATQSDAEAMMGRRRVLCAQSSEKARRHSQANLCELIFEGQLGRIEQRWRRPAWRGFERVEQRGDFADVCISRARDIAWHRCDRTCA